MWLLALNVCAITVWPVWQALFIKIEIKYHYKLLFANLAVRPVLEAAGCDEQFLLTDLEGGTQDLCPGWSSDVPISSSWTHFPTPGLHFSCI